MTIQNKSREDSVQKEDNEEDDGEADNEQEHDPHFEPIIPLPDAIEVRTGEEDEEKGSLGRLKNSIFVNKLDVKSFITYSKNYLAY